MIFNKMLIANRGEIACRVMRTCKRLGIATVAVYSDADRHAMHVEMADKAVHIGAAKAADSYLNMDRILAAAKQTGAEAIHPGYGFLSENAEFARRCIKAGVVFIGPSPESMDAMASKSAAVTLMEKAGVPVTPGYHGKDQSFKKLMSEAQRTGFPLLIKPSAGGGGKGMHIVRSADEFKEALETAKREAKNAFGDDSMLLEKYIQQPRHIEFQIFGDSHGKVVHLFERECSLQRRFQKVVEETPSPFLDETTRLEMGEAAVAAAKAVNYVNAGTIEFIVGADRSFHFMEMNTRLQVEHPITEEITGLDLVEWQLRVAAGEKLPLTQNQIKQRGHAIEVRLYAENVEKGFLPMTGHIEAFPLPQGEGVRVDTGVRGDDEINIYYDPMIAKLSVWDKDRGTAIKRLQQALAQTAIFGLTTNLPLLRGIAKHPDFAAGTYDTGFIERQLGTLLTEPKLSAPALAAAGVQELTRLSHHDGTPWQTDAWRLGGTQGLQLVVREASGKEQTIGLRGNADTFTLEWNGESHPVAVDTTAAEHWLLNVDGKVYSASVLSHDQQFQIALEGNVFLMTLADPHAPRSIHRVDTVTHPASPMPGRVVVVHVKAGDKVCPGQALLVLEGMKMEYTVKADVTGRIEKIFCKEGDMVDSEVTLVNITPLE
ncbi:MAG: acetyl-CoA carboxylase biotin carboxylase subunit [Gammaproteobacteria bacterium]